MDGSRLTGGVALPDGMTVVVINLDRSPDRLAQMGAQLDAHDIRWTRFPAIEPDEESLAQDKRVNQIRAVQLYGRKLSKGEVGCYLSHMSVLKTFLESDHRFLLVLEDDVVLSRDGLAMAAYLCGPDAAIPSTDWHCANLSETYPKRRVVRGRFGDVIIYRAYHFPMLASGLIWTGSGAEAMLNFFDALGICGPVDHELRRLLWHSGMGISFPRALFPQSGAESTIDLRGRPKGPVNRRARPRRKLPGYALCLYHRLKGT